MAGVAAEPVCSGIVMAPIRLQRSTGDAERGAALVEFALAVPLLLVVIAGIVDFGFVYQRYEVITNAAREGARLASLPGYDAADVEAHVRAYVAQGLSVADTTVVMPPSGTPKGVEVTYQDLTISGQNIPTALVTVNYQHNFLLLGPLLSLISGSWGGTITLTSSSQMRIELPGS
jgi:Flp pilus assembly protein TadG